jgi:hypothetical protein
MSYGEISNRLSINLDTEQSMAANEKKPTEIDCVMNQLKIFSTQESYLSFTCNTCPGKPDNICYLCMEKCHKNHNLNAKSVNEKRVDVLKTPCSCARNYHQVTRQDSNINQVRIENQELQCTLNEIFHVSDMEFYYLDSTWNTYFCIYCLNFCQDEEMSARDGDIFERYTKVDKKQFNQEGPLCCCTNTDCHSPFYENITCLTTLITAPVVDRFLNRMQLPARILENSHLLEKYLDPIKQIHSEILINYKEGNFTKYKNEETPKIYLNSLYLLKSFSDVFSEDNDTYLVTNVHVQSLFNFEFLNLLFSYSEDYFLVETKFLCLLFFRKFYLLPVSKTKAWHNIFSDFDNVSPLHRYIFKQTINDFLEETKLDKSGLISLIGKIHSTIFKFYDKVDDIMLGNLVVEYLELLNLIISFKYEDDKYLYLFVVDKFMKLCELIYPKKGLENTLKPFIENFVIKVFLINNDQIFINKVFLKNSEENHLHSKTEHPGNNSEICENLDNSNLGIYQQEHKFNSVNSKQNFLSNFNIGKKNYVELDEEEEEVTGRIARMHTKFKGLSLSGDKFIFQDGEFQMKIIKSLFSFNKEENDKVSGVQPEIYDILMNKQDFYLESIKSFENSNISDFFKNSDENSERSKYLKLFFQPLYLINGNLFSMFTDKEILILKNLKDLTESLEHNKIRYYEAHLNEKSFYEITYKILTSCRENLFSIGLIDEKMVQLNTGNLLDKEPVESKIDSQSSLFFKQMYLFKVGFFDMLILIWNIFGSNERIKNNIGNSKINQLLKEVLNVMKLVTIENSFLISIFFNKKLLNIFFNKNSENISSNIDSERSLMVNDIYLYNLRILAKHKYKLNVLNYIKILLEEVDQYLKEYSKWYKANNAKNAKKSASKNRVSFFNIDNIQKSPQKISSSLTKESILANLSVILKCLSRSTKICTDKTKDRGNNIIGTALKSMITLENEDDPSAFYDSLDEMRSNLKKKLPSNPLSEDYLFYIYKNINQLDDGYFSLISDFINFQDLVEKLRMFEELDPVWRRILTKIYSRYQVQTPFTIFPNVSKLDLDNMMVNVDVNVVGRFKNISDENILPNRRKDSSNRLDGSPGGSSSSYSGFLNSLSANKKIQFLKNINLDRLEEKDDITPQAPNSPEGRLARLVTSKTTNKEMDPLVLLTPIILNLEKYRRVTKIFLDGFRGNLDFFLKYYTDVIAMPCIFSIYKILYFSARTTAKFKYMTYRFVYLFLECFKLFLSLLLNNSMCLINSEENEKKLMEYFNFDSQKISIREFLTQLSDSLEADLLEFNSQNFEPLKMKYVVEKWTEQMCKLKLATGYLIKHESEGERHVNAHVSNVLNTINSQKEESSPRLVVKKSHSIKELFFNEADESSEDKEQNEEIKLKLLTVQEFIDEYETKKENLEDNALLKIFTESDEEDSRGKEIKKTITLDMLSKIDAVPSNTQFLSLYNEVNSILFESMNKLFKADPDYWQGIIISNCNEIKPQIYAFIRSHLTFLFQLILIDFNKLKREEDSGDCLSSSMNNFQHVMEFLRLLCENHHKIFQTLLTQIYIRMDDVDFLDYILKLPVIILKNIEYFKKKKDILIYFKKNPSSTPFFNEFLAAITDFLIEVIQGAFAHNFKKISESYDFINYYETAYKCIDSIDLGEEYEIFLCQFIRFLNCYMDENSNATENKIQIIKKLNPQKLLVVLMHSFKKLFYVHEKEVEQGSVTAADLHNYCVPAGAGEAFINIFLNDEDIGNNHLFVLASGIFKYFKTAILWKSGDKVQKLLDNLKSLADEPYEKIDRDLPEKIKHQVILKREVYIFFNKTIKEVEVSYRFKENIEEGELLKFKELFDEDFFEFDRLKAEMHIELQGIQKVVYLVHPDSLFLEQSDIDKFTEDAPFENFNIKLNFILIYYNTLIYSLQMRKLLWQINSKVLNFLFKLNYLWALYLSVFLSIIVNFLVILSTSTPSLKMRTTKPKPDIHTNHTYYNHTITNQTNNLPQPYQSSNDLSVHFYDETVTMISSLHLIYLFLIICNFMGFNILKMQKFINAESNLPMSEMISNWMSLLMSKDIAPLVWNLLTGFFAIIHPSNKFIYSLQLFTIFKLVPTMQSVIYSVRVRYKQFLSAALLISILILFYSSVSFYLFRSDFYNKETDENLCSSFLHCFLTLITNGIRAGAGLGFPLQSIRNKQQYFSKFIFEWIFYFSIILIMINVINGIIVDTFQALREQSNKKEDIQKNVCYICSINRSKFETRGISFHHHKFVEHNILNYFFYILKIKFTDEQDLNSLDYEVLKSIKKMRTDFFPVKKALSLGNVS